MQDEAEDCVNYGSSVEAGEKAQRLLDEMVEKKRATLAHSWKEVVDLTGSHAQITKMGCIVKQKDDGTEKVRLIFDGRRSGINGLIQCRERVTLPKVSDVAKAFLQLKSQDGWSPAAYPKLFSADLKDAFHILQLREDERGFVVVKGWPTSEGHPRYYISNCVVFGLSTGPLLWCRLAAAAMKLGQAVLESWEADVHCYIDDPIIVSMATSEAGQMRNFVRYVGLWCALGLELSWGKVAWGKELQWIGFKFTIQGEWDDELRVQLADSKKEKLLEVFAEVEAYRGMVPLYLLQYAVGVLGWLSSAVPVARPWMAMIWAAITQARHPQ